MFTITMKFRNVRIELENGQNGIVDDDVSITESIRTCCISRQKLSSKEKKYNAVNARTFIF